MGLIGGLGEGVGLIGGLGRGVDRRLRAWVLGRLGPVTLRLAEGHELGDGAWGDRQWGLAWVGETDWR